MISAIKRLYDSELEVANISPNALIEEEFARLQDLAGMAAWSGLIPRRLGGDATSLELRRDKRLARAISHAALGAAKLWKPQPLLREVDARRSATVVWDEWAKERSAYTGRRRVYFATWATLWMHESLGNQFIHRLDLEDMMIDRIMGQ